MQEKTSEKKKSKRAARVRRVRGMQDFLPERAAALARIARIAENVARLYGFERIETPILEQAQLFRRSLGLASDVVMKEMYAFEDKNDEELCLRPEGTAGAIRALIDGGLTQTLPQRWFYEGPMFRRERPQKGRYRQFHQCGIELLHKPVADPTNIAKELEVILCAWQLLKEIGLKDKVELKINWLGTEKQRAEYSDDLQKYFQEHADDDALSPASIERLQRGSPMRILDSKDPHDQAAIENAPPFLNKVSKFNLEKIETALLENFKIQCSIDSRLVRGLDYYNGLVFEFVEKDTMREQATVLAGGRYDGLCEQLGGHPVCAIGWAAGLERLLELSAGVTLDSKIKIALICDFDDAEVAAFVSDVRDILYKKIFHTKNRDINFVICTHYGGEDNNKFNFVIAVTKIRYENFRVDVTNVKMDKRICCIESDANLDGVVNEIKAMLGIYDDDGEDA